jgi:hypothetical protein
MTLDQWRISKRFSYSKLAEQLGAPHATVARRWCLPAEHNNRVIPSGKYMERVVLLTNGSVTPNDFYLRRN